MSEEIVIVIIASMRTTPEVTVWSMPVVVLQVDFQQKEAELFAPHSILPWFTWDTKLGSLTLHLDSKQTFAAEVYAYSMGLQVRTSSSASLCFMAGSNLQVAAVLSIGPHMFPLLMYKLLLAVLYLAL